MEHYTVRLGAGGGGASAAAAAQQLSWGGEPDRRSRFWQTDSAAGRIEVICPQPRRPARPPFLMEPVVSRASSKPPNGFVSFADIIMIIWATRLLRLVLLVMPWLWMTYACLC